jgi:hypothetical protein
MGDLVGEVLETLGLAHSVGETPMRMSDTSATAVPAPVAGQHATNMSPDDLDIKRS